MFRDDGNEQLQESKSQKKAPQKGRVWDFPGGPVAKTPHFHCRGHRFATLSGY